VAAVGARSERLSSPPEGRVVAKEDAGGPPRRNQGATPNVSLHPRVADRAARATGSVSTGRKMVVCRRSRCRSWSASASSRHSIGCSPAQGEVKARPRSSRARRDRQLQSLAGHRGRRPVAPTAGAQHRARRASAPIPAARSWELRISLRFRPVFSTILVNVPLSSRTCIGTPGVLRVSGASVCA
jgi:hypothetical protein